MSINTLQKYVQRMKCLRRDEAHGDPAPHKPLLLLAVIEMIEQGQIHENRIYFSSDLRKVFNKYWSKVKNERPNMVMPFFHLKNDGKEKNDSFWFLQPIPGREKTLEKILESGEKIRGISRLHEAVAYASLKDDLFFLLTNPQHRETIRQTIIDFHLTDFKNEIKSFIHQQRLITEQQIEKYKQSLLHRAKQPFSPQESRELVQSETPIRRAGFRKAIMGLYDYTCVVCRLRIVTSNGESATDAAHIIPFSISHDDDVRNGISLCKLHHWAFDTGLISLSEVYRVIVTQLAEEQGPMEWKLSKLANELILLPKHDLYHPAPEALEWHRKRWLGQ